MNYGQLGRAIDALYDIGKPLDEETPVKIFVDGKYREVIALYPEDMDGEIVLVAEAGR